LVLDELQGEFDALIRPPSAAANQPLQRDTKCGYATLRRLLCHVKPRIHRGYPLTTLHLSRDDAAQFSFQLIMPIPCPRCGAEIEHGAAVCVHCGNSAAQPSAPALFNSSTPDADHHLEGLGGWLILLAIGLIVSPFFLLYPLLTTYVHIFTDPVSKAVLQASHSIYMLVLSEVITNIVLIVMLLWLNYLFFTKRRTFPTFMILFMVLQCIVVAADNFAAYAVTNSAQVLTPNPTQIRAILSAAIWIPYFLVSRRVKVTFVH
jgi:hypothetical protein